MSITITEWLWNPANQSLNPSRSISVAASNEAEARAMINSRLEELNALDTEEDDVDGNALWVVGGDFNEPLYAIYMEHV